MIQLRLRILPIWNAKHRQILSSAAGKKACVLGQLAALRQVSHLIQRSHPRAKKKPDPRIMHSCPEAHRWEMAGLQIMVTIMGNNLLVEPEEVCYNGGQLKARNYLCFCDKYEQTVEHAKNHLQKAFFRIFWKILAKTGPQSLYLCGFPEASVEMKVAPFRALTQPGHGY